MTDFDAIYYHDVLPEFEAVQRTLDGFTEINYNSALDAYYHRSGINMEQSLGFLEQQMLDILTDNPPLASIPVYYDNGRENYLWYSDFYDDITKECLVKYSKFAPLAVQITPANYAIELDKVDLPYFKELVKLVGLIRLIAFMEGKVVKIDEPVEAGEEPFDPSTITPDALPSPTRSYEPKMSGEQLSLLMECIKTLGLFKDRITAAQLGELLEGKQPRLFRVTNQKILVFLFDSLAENGYIKKSWISVAGYNCDFASVQPRWMERKHGSRLHHITSQQLTNCRRLNKIQSIKGVNTIEETIERMADRTDSD
ncbi:MAG: hypothetical protein FWE10_05990 [Rikenellaceae bacterium]|nr:hypothetical protein [Rikenellaceae bacterium]MCL2692956.1 hypothetical protein [Rikenellaceae bacterium]